MQANLEDDLINSVENGATNYDENPEGPVPVPDPPDVS